MVRRAEDAAADGGRDGVELDVHAEMAALTLAIVGETLFGTDVDEERSATVAAGAHRHAVDVRPRVLAGVPAARPAAHPDDAPLPPDRGRPEPVIDELIAERRAERADGDDLLSLLLRAREDGAGMTDDAGARRGAHALPRRSRDHRERARLDLVAPVAAPVRRGSAARRARCERSGAVARRWTTCRALGYARDRARPSRSGCGRRPGRSVGARSATSGSGEPDDRPRARSSWSRRGCCTTTRDGGRSPRPSGPSDGLVGRAPSGRGSVRAVRRGAEGLRRRAVRVDGGRAPALARSRSDGASGSSRSGRRGPAGRHAPAAERAPDARRASRAASSLRYSARRANVVAQLLRELIDELVAVGRVDRGRDGVVQRRERRDAGRGPHELPRDAQLLAEEREREQLAAARADPVRRGSRR